MFVDVCYGVKLKSLNCVRLFATPWTIHVTPFTIQSMGFSRQDIGVDSISLSRGLPNPGFKPRFSTLQVDSLPAEPQGKHNNTGVNSLPLL